VTRAQASREDGRTLTPGASPLDAIAAARCVDGLTAGEKHALVTLATYWPNVYPSTERLRSDMSRSRSVTLDLLRRLEARGLMTTRQRGNGRTAERTLHLPAVTREDS
jgi:hypothetical protein